MCRFCDNAWQRERTKNQFSPLRTSKRLALFARLMSKIFIDPEISWNGTPCWQWTGNVGEFGYGGAWYKGSTRSAHRVVYSVFIEEVAEDLECDHLCRRRHCVTPPI